MGEKTLKFTYNNPLGYMTEKEFEELKNKPNEEIIKWLKNFKITENKCPPKKKCTCQHFQCEKCYARAIGKDFYKYVLKQIK